MSVRDGARRAMVWEPIGWEERIKDMRREAGIILACGALALVIAGAGESSRLGKAEVSLADRTSVTALQAQTCSVTIWNGFTPEGAEPSSRNHGSDSQMVRLWPGGRVEDPRSVRSDGSIAIKMGWWRGAPDPLRITGRRVDEASAPPLLGTTAPVEAYPETGFIPATLHFPSRGCWEVTGELAGERLSFVVSVEVGRDVRPIPTARLVLPRKSEGRFVLRWVTNVSDQSSFDLTVKSGGRWRLLAERHEGQSFALGTSASSISFVRVRARDAFGKGAWSKPWRLNMRGR